MFDLMTTQQKTYETLQQSGDNHIFNQTSGSLSTSMTMSKRLANATSKHTNLLSKWNKQIDQITAQRASININMTQSKKKLEKTLRNTSLGSLMERQATFKYDEHGSKKSGFYWQHKSPRRDLDNPADLQRRVNQFYQNCRGSDVAYVTTQQKNPGTMLWSTSPTNRMSRGESIKKDIANLPKVSKKSKVFRGYSNQ